MKNIKSLIPSKIYENYKFELIDDATLQYRCRVDDEQYEAHIYALIDCIEFPDGKIHVYTGEINVEDLLNEEPEEVADLIRMYGYAYTDDNEETIDKFFREAGYNDETEGIIAEMKFETDMLRYDCIGVFNNLNSAYKFIVNYCENYK